MMSRRLMGVGVLLAAVLLLAVPTLAEEEQKKEIGKWYPTLETGLNLLQSSYSDNWAGGDKGSINWSWLLNGTLDRRFNETLDWGTTLKLAFGQTHTQERRTGGDLYWEKPEKTTDMIDLESIMRFTLGGYVDPYASARFNSQFQDESDPAGRAIKLNPLIFSEAAGIARQYIEEENRSLLVRLGFAMRQSSRKFFTDPAPVEDTTSESTTDGGIELISDYKDLILNDRVTWTSRLAFYQPLFFSGKSNLDDLSAAQLTAAGLDEDIAGYTTAVDVDWENIFTSQITKAISVSFYLRWIYDKYDNSVKPVLNDSGDALTNPDVVAQAVRKSGQFKQTMTIGVTYRFF